MLVTLGAKGLKLQKVIVNKVIVTGFININELKILKCIDKQFRISRIGLGKARHHYTTFGINIYSAPNYFCMYTSTSPPFCKL